jgi:NADPH:quinone reductase-like Zn-dependent oxidoreductase
MRAVGVVEFGGPEALGIHDIPEPHPGANEVRIHVRAVAVSPTDLGLRNGGYDTTNAEPPHIPGMDAAGVIDELGEGSTWQIGDEVMALEGRSKLSIAEELGLSRFQVARSLQKARESGLVRISVDDPGDTNREEEEHP